MAKKKPVNMDEKAANAGDRMKHALSLEVLSRTHSWKNVTYAETHAGAGIYLEERQRKPPHIRELRDIVLRESVRQRVEAPAVFGDGQHAGCAYLDLLAKWWSDVANDGQYPGSAKQAILYLERTRPDRSFEIRLTEKAEDAFERLKNAVYDLEAEPRNASFLDELSWLTEPDNLLLVVDPFRCVESFDLSEATGINRGDIDHRVIRDLLKSCETKRAAVLHFWWSTRSQPGGSEMDKIVTASHRAARTLLHEWKQGGHSRAVREFQDKHNHASPLIGIGDGARIVGNIPVRTQWRASWLKPFIAESRCKGGKSPTVKEIA